VGKKINSYTNNLTPDTFTVLYEDNDATEISKERYLYYENKNITKLSQIENILSSLARETSKRVIKLNVRVRTDHVFSLLERLEISGLSDNFNGYWSVYEFSCTRNAYYQQWDLVLVRSNTIIIPELNIYSKNTINKYTNAFIEGTLKAIVTSNLSTDVTDNLNLSSTDTINCFIPYLNKTVKAFNLSNLKANKGQVCYVKKMPFSNEWALLSVETSDLRSNAEKVHFYTGNSDDIDTFNGGFTTSFINTWDATGLSSVTTRPYNQTASTFSVSSYISSSLGNGEFSIVLTMSEAVNPATINKTSFQFLQ
jgi:hypothetical protein